MKQVNIKIFLTFLILFTLFIQWNDAWDQSSDLSVSRSIVNENKFNSKKYKQFSPLLMYEEKFGLKDYGVPYLATFPYLVGKKTAPSIPQNVLPREKKILYERGLPQKLLFKKSPSLSFNRFFVTLFFGPLLGALSVLIIYKILGLFIDSFRDRLFLTFAYGLGTALFPYSTAFYKYIPSIVLLSTSLLILMFYKRKKNISWHFKFLSGLLAGFSCLIFKLSIIPAFMIFIYYVFKVEKNHIKSYLFLFGAFIGFLPAFMYMGTVSGFGIGQVHEPSGALAQNLNYWSVMSSPQHIPQIMLRNLFYPFNGIFIYSPFLIFSFYGLYLMYKEGKRAESYLLAILFFLILLATSLYPNWWGNYSFGPRRLLILIPFLIVPLGFYLKESDRNSISRKLFVVLVIISIGINFMGTQVWSGLGDTRDIDKELDSWKPLKNPIATKYIPLTVQNGPRSILLENLISKNKIDIWKAPQVCMSFDSIQNRNKILGTFFGGILMLYIPFLAFYIAISVLIAFLMSLKAFKTLFVGKRRKIIFCLILMFLISFPLFFLRIGDKALGSGWDSSHRNNVFNGRKSVINNGTVYFYSSKSRKANLNFEASTYFKKQEMRILLNEKVTETIFMDRERTRYNITDLSISKGLNKVVFSSDKGCKFLKPSECRMDCYSSRVGYLELQLH